MLRRLRLWSDCLKHGGGRGGRRHRGRFAAAVATLESRVLLAITIELRYELDSNNFFDTQAKKDLLQLAANNIASRLNDSLSAIQPSDTNHWSAQFFNPATGALQSMPDLVVAANTLVIYVGGRALNGNERGFGGPGGYSWSGTTNWGSTVEGRGQAGTLALIPTDTSPWGGAITFDTRANWFFGSTTTGLRSNQTDFLSVAEHEIGHVLGIGDNPTGGPPTAWSRLVANGAFHGPNAMATEGNTPVPLDPSGAHWATGTSSAGQEAAMTPVLTDGTRKLFTPLDFAGLADIGWMVQATGTITFSAGAYRVSEGAGAAEITIKRSDATDFAIVQFDTFGGTATPGQDYYPFSVRLVFGPGESSKTLRLLTINDSRPEANKTVNLSLHDPVNTGLGPITQAVLTIVDDDRPNNGSSDFDGDGTTDLTVFRPSQARWLGNLSGGGTLNALLGEPNLVDIPAPGDYDGDGKTDLVVFRPSTAQWLGHLSSGGILNTFCGYPNYVDIPAPGDFDGDGKTDIAVYRPSQGLWTVRLSSGGVQMILQGEPNLVDIPAPGDYDGDGKTDFAVFRPSQGLWIARLSGGGVMIAPFGELNLFDIPVPGDYDGDGRTDLAVFRPSQGRWLARLSSGGLMNLQYGALGLQDVPTQASVGSLIALGLLRPGGSASFASASSFAIGSQAAAGSRDLSVPVPAEPVAQGLAFGSLDRFGRPRPSVVAKRYRLE